MSVYSKMLMDMMAVASVVLSDDTILNPKEVEEEKDIEMRMDSNGVYTEKGEESVDNIKKIGIVGMGGITIVSKSLELISNKPYSITRTLSGERSDYNYLIDMTFDKSRFPCNYKEITDIKKISIYNKDNKPYEYEELTVTISGDTKGNNFIEMQITNISSNAVYDNISIDVVIESTEGSDVITLKQLMIQPSWQYNKVEIFDPKIKELLELANKQELIDDIKDNIRAFEERDIFIKAAGFSLITKNFIKALSEWIGDRSVLEIMAGTGYISKSLKDEGVNIVAVTDIKESCWGFKKEWTEVEKLSANEAIMKYNNVDIIICSWAYMDNTMYAALLTMREYNPNAIILYIGEDHGGCTANDNFFENLISIEDKDFEENVIPLYRRWGGIHDEPRLIK